MVKGGDKEKMKKQIITLTAIVAILAAAIFAGCVEKETPVSTPPPTTTILPKTTPTSVVPTATSTPEHQNQLHFLEEDKKLHRNSHLRKICQYSK